MSKGAIEVRLRQGSIRLFSMKTIKFSPAGDHHG